jgi:hypothetical protein
MSQPARQRTPKFDATNHPIAWFAALLRGVDERDPILVHAAQYQLERLGYCIVTMPAADSAREAAR